MSSINFILYVFVVKSFCQPPGQRQGNFQNDLKQIMDMELLRTQLFDVVDRIKTKECEKREKCKTDGGMPEV